MHLEIKNTKASADLLLKYFIVIVKTKKIEPN